MPREEQHFPQCPSPCLPSQLGNPSCLALGPPPATLPLPYSLLSPGIKEKQPWAKYNFI